MPLPSSRGCTKAGPRVLPSAPIFTNKDARSQDYTRFARLPRPSHADYTGLMRSAGANDPRGGGAFFGRLTAPFVWREPSACRCSKARNCHILRKDRTDRERSWTHRWIWPGQIWLCSQELAEKDFPGDRWGQRAGDDRRH